MKKINRTEPIEAELTRNAIRAAQEKENYRNAWTDIIYSNGPYACLLTLQFQRNYSDKATLPAANQFFYNLNRKYFGRRWFRKKWGFSGIVVAEQNKSRASTAGTLHFHCLLHTNEYLRDILSDFDLHPFHGQAINSARKLKDTQNRFMCSRATGVDVRKIHDLTGVTDYVTKELDDYVSESGDQIYTLTYKGLETGCLDSWRKRTC
jgi:hypothetical protein